MAFKQGVSLAVRSRGAMQRSRQKPLVLAFGATLCALGWVQASRAAEPAVLLAQASPTPQSLPAPTAPTAPAATFRLNDVRFNGASAVPTAELRALAQPYIGRDVALGDLEALAQAVTSRYKEAGFFLAQAVVPVQTIKDGVVEISVIEGRIGKVTVEIAPDAPIREARVRAFIESMTPGKAVSAGIYERAMLLLSDQPGLKVSSSLQEGLEPGTTDLTVEVAAAPRFTFAAEADNHGSQESGRYRVGGTVRWLSPFGIGDNIDVRAMVSNGNALQFGRVAYEAPLGTNGWRGGIGLARVNYELGGKFSQLQAQGTADVLDVSLNYPLIRQRQHNLFLRLSADSKRLNDDIGAEQFSDKRVQGFGIGWTWERRDAIGGGGYWSSSGNFYRGDLSIRNAEGFAADQSIYGYHTEGGYSKLTAQLARLQAIGERTSLFLSVGGQWASKNLDSSEKLALGGARAVRAYASGEALVDQGVVGIAEVRWSFNDELTPFFFYDAARGRLAKEPLLNDDDNSISLRGYGLGLSWSRPGNFSVNATVAWRDGTRRPLANGGNGRSPRLYVQAQKVF